MVDRSVVVKVDGLDRAVRSIRRAKDRELNAELKDANKKVSDLVAYDARGLVNSVSGALAASVRAAPTARHGQVRAGRGKTRDYAGVVHYLRKGQKAKGKRGARFITRSIERNWKRIETQYVSSVQKILNKL